MIIVLSCVFWALSRHLFKLNKVHYSLFAVACLPAQTTVENRDLKSSKQRNYRLSTVIEVSFLTQSDKGSKDWASSFTITINKVLLYSTQILHQNLHFCTIKTRKVGEKICIIKEYEVGERRFINLFKIYTLEQTGSGFHAFTRRIIKKLLQITPEIKFKLSAIIKLILAYIIAASLSTRAEFLFCG